MCNTDLPLQPGGSGTDRESQQKLQVCENWVRIVRVKRVDRSRMGELREGIGVQMSLTGRLVKCRMRWAGHLVRMGKERMAKRVDGLREQGRRKRGRPWLRWENCMRRVDVGSDSTEVPEHYSTYTSVYKEYYPCTSDFSMNDLEQWTIPSLQLVL